MPHPRSKFAIVRPDDIRINGSSLMRRGRAIVERGAAGRKTETLSRRNRAASLLALRVSPVIPADAMTCLTQRHAVVRLNGQIRIFARSGSPCAVVIAYAPSS